ncbi:hypothetical protein ADEAN_001048100 [Angomonas deanei]|uniref:Uncharacterized protein n=1 Tax=Angomonas deanei TaxID=59799 RepID=A0A7G2CTR1_9TRYP|nr:hypothetical protein ADEAN_001048100 [Angomonas deanei]
MADFTVDEDKSDYVLNYGIPKTDVKRRALQEDGFLNIQRKIVTREDVARALIISANVLSMSVMSSQLSMYRWKVSEAQTIAQATSLLQEEVVTATKRGYVVQRERPKPVGLSKYTTEEGLKNLFELKNAKMERKQQKMERKRQEAAAAAAAGRPVPYSSGDDSTDEEDEETTNGNAHQNHTPCHSSDDDDSHSCDSVCSAERGGKRGGRQKARAPAGTITRLVIVDTFTHEPFQDILDHIRYIDKEYGLQLVMVLLLPPAADAVGMQGTGVVLNPQYQVTLEQAYGFGYDLVLTHYVDHVVVDFLTQAFVSSAGRWKNDMRANAAVGNYISLKNVLMGRIDIDALRQLAFDEEVADEEILALLGNQTLAQRGESKHYGSAGNKLSQKVEGGADVLVIEDEDPQELSSMFPSSLPRLRSAGNISRNGVQSANGRLAFVPLSGFSTEKDLINTIMKPSKAVMRTQRQRKKNAADWDESDAAYEEVLVDDDDAGKATLLDAIEGEMARLMADCDQKQSTIDDLTGELEKLHRTVAVLKRNHSVFENESGSGDIRPGSASFVNLSKEQQIYILKERLEEANKRIDAFTSGGQRSSSAGSRGKRPPLRAPPSSSGGRTRGAAERQLRTAHIRYQEAREREAMRLHDIDSAIFAENAVVESYAERSAQLNDDPLVYTVQADSPEIVLQRRREKELTDRTIGALQAEIRKLEMKTGTDPKLLQQLSEVLQRLEAQKSRIVHLEEMRKMDELLFARQLQTAIQKVSEEYEDQHNNTSGGPTTSGKKGKKKEAPTSSRHKGGRGGGGTSARGEPSTTGDSANVVKLTAQHKKQLAKLQAEYEEKLNHIREETLLEAEKYHKQHRQERDGEIQATLEKLYLKIRKPYTPEYRKVLEEELSLATRNARGGAQRIRYALQQFASENKTDGAEAQEGLFANLTDPAQQEKIREMAMECASYLLQAKRAQEAIELLEDAHKENAGLGQLRHLLQERVSCQEQAEALLHTPGTELDPYLESLLEVAVLNEDITLWGDVPIGPFLRSCATGTAPGALQCTLSPEDTGAETTTARLTDVDGTLREIGALITLVGGGSGKSSTKKTGSTGRGPTTAADSDAGQKMTGEDKALLKKGKKTKTGKSKGQESAPAAPLKEHVGILEEMENVSLVQKEIYKNFLSAYREGMVHPDRMLDIEQEASRVNSISQAEWTARYLTHHQELLRLLTLITSQFPSLAPLIQPYTMELEKILEYDVQGGANPVRVPFLMATDTALVTCAVDYLRDAWGVALAPRAEDNEEEEEEGEEYNEAQERFRRSFHHINADDTRLAEYDAVRRAAIEQYKAKQAAAAPDNTYDEVMAYLRGAGDGEDGGPQYTPAELAAMFSKKSAIAGVNPEELYLREMANAMEGDDEYAEMFNDIRAELQYLNEMKEQRMGELLLRYRQHQKDRSEGVVSGPRRPPRKGSNFHYDYNGDVPDFEVREGSPAWYGMEAAKRVRDILRRKKKADQVILGGGPDGGDVGVELSRRTAFPKPSPASQETIMSIHDRLRAARALPPVERRGLSRRQLSQHGERQEYVAPRDELNVNAYSRIASNYTFDGADRHYNEVPDELVGQLESYRDNLTRIASRVGTGVGARGRVGENSYVPVPASSGGLPPSSSGRQALPQVTRWTYGMSEDDATRLLKESQTTAQDPDTMLFVPTKLSPAEQAEQNRRTRRVNFGPEFMNQPTGNKGYVNPATMAAMRLNALLQVSMDDPTVGN